MNIQHLRRSLTISYHGESRHFPLLDIVDDVVAFNLDCFVGYDENVHRFDDDQTMIYRTARVEEIGFEYRLHRWRSFLWITLLTIVQCQHCELPKREKASGSSATLLFRLLRAFFCITGSTAQFKKL